MLLVNTDTRLIVFIPCHNRKDTTQESIKHIYNVVNKKWELTVHIIADGCTDGTVDMIKKQHRKVEIHELNGKQYWGGCLNYITNFITNGNSICNDDIILIANDDAYLSEKSLDMGVNYLINSKNSALIPILADASAESFSRNVQHQKILDINKDQIDVNWGNIYDAKLDKHINRRKPGCVNLGVTASILIKKSELIKAQRIPVGIPHYYSDFWMTYSLSLHGVAMTTNFEYYAIRKKELTRKSYGEKTKIKYWEQCCNPQSPDYLPAGILFTKHFSRGRGKRLKLMKQYIKFTLLYIVFSKKYANKASMQTTPVKLMVDILNK